MHRKDYMRERSSLLGGFCLGFFVFFNGFFGFFFFLCVCVCLLIGWMVWLWFGGFCVFWGLFFFFFFLRTGKREDKRIKDKGRQKTVFQMGLIQESLQTKGFRRMHELLWTQCSPSSVELWSQYKCCHSLSIFEIHWVQVSFEKLSFKKQVDLAPKMSVTIVLNSLETTEDLVVPNLLPVLWSRTSAFQT